jgi:hypothetical protein
VGVGRVALAAVAMALIGLGAQRSVARADRAAVDAARVDWAAGRIVAGGTGIADRHAPSPAVALGTSRRGAEGAARKRLADEAAKLPLATGGTLGQAARDPVVRARIAAAIAAANEVAAEPETDGSWHVSLAVPLEALRLAIAGPRALSPAGDRGPQVVVVEGVTAKPALGWTIGGVAGATVWVKSVKDLPAWAREAPRITATSAARGAIGVSGTSPASAATLFVLVGRG